MRYALACLIALLIPAFGQNTLTNPLLPSGPDPWVIFHDGFYYHTHTTGRDVTLWKTADIGKLGTAEKKVVWTPPSAGPNSREVWAPELHFLAGKWYLYFAADDGRNEDHRMWALENGSPDPMSDGWMLKGKVADSSDKWAIDGTALDLGGHMYFAWSGWPGDTDGEQDIYIARLKNPWTIDGPRVRISAPEFDWEKHGDLPGPRHVNVNEAPEFLVHGSDVFLTYSASGCWTDDAEIGLLRLKSGADPLKASSWQKSRAAAMAPAPENNVYDIGHNGFFKSPDGKQDWIIYHANPGPHQGCGNRRSPRAQPFTWNADGTPNFGTPVPAGPLTK